LRARAITVEIRGARLRVAHPEDLMRMKSAAAGFRDRPEAKRRQDLDDIAVLERLRAERDAAAASRVLDATRGDTAPGSGTSEGDQAARARPSRTSPQRPQERRRR
jgi:hypothetical protein